MELEEFISQFEAARIASLETVAGLDQDRISVQIHPEFSPLGWHLGHIAYTEALWLVAEDGGEPMPRPAFAGVFAVDALPKAARSNLPPLTEILDYAEEIRHEVMIRLRGGAAGRARQLWWFVLQHESQHCETMTFLRWLGGAREADAALESPEPERIEIPAGPFSMGCQDATALDNERAAHKVDLGTYAIDRYPVTQGAYAEFIAAGGYARMEFWSPEGWDWRQMGRVERPLYWIDDAPGLPVIGVGFYEAEAYCRFRGSRLPTEAEWEKAARWDPETGETSRFPWGDEAPDDRHGRFDRRSGGPAPAGIHPAGRSAAGCDDLLGNQWEWTATSFAPYDGFRAYPYEGYSKAYFDGQHRVIRGGSWATRIPVLRSSFRNWYMPYVREILVGFRSVGEAGRRNRG